MTDFGQSHLQQNKLHADILHKNSFYYNQGAMVNEATENHRLKSVREHCCEWKECRAKFLSNKDLIRHVLDEHISSLPLNNSSEYQYQRQLVCQWRKCREKRCYPARYKLLLHLQQCHCNHKHIDMVCFFFFTSH